MYGSRQLRPVQARRLARAVGRRLAAVQRCASPPRAGAARIRGRGLAARNSLRRIDPAGFARSALPAEEPRGRVNSRSPIQRDAAGNRTALAPTLPGCKLQETGSRSVDELLLRITA